MWRTRSVVVIAAAVLLSRGAADASERAEIAKAQGLIEFHAGNFVAALTAFDEAQRDDPEDPYIRYYRGVTRGRLMDLDGAIEDLRAALAAKPDLDRAALELGVALVQTHAYAEAVPWLEQAQRSAELDGEASLYRGRAQFELGEIDTARADWERAARDPAQAAAARYYLGIAAYRTGAWDEAAAQFRACAEAAPGSEIGRQAQAYLRILRRYVLSASLGLEYDSNVVLAPSDGALKSALGISNQADGRATIQLGADYVLWRTPRLQLWLGYHFSQTLQFRLTDFDLQDHQPLVQLVYDADPVQLGALSSYDYYLLETDSFFQQPLAMVWTDVAEGNLGRSSVSFRFRYRDFFESPFRGVRNAFNYSPALIQYFYLGRSERYLWGEYRFDKEDPETTAGLPFGYTGNQVGGGIGWALPAQITADAGYAYRHERYRSQSDGRRDNEHLVNVDARRPLNDWLQIGCGFFADINNSTVGVFEYDRYVVSVTLDARF